MKTNQHTTVGSNLSRICEHAALFQGRKEAGSSRDIHEVNDQFNKSKGRPDWSFRNDHAAVQPGNLHAPIHPKDAKQVTSHIRQWSPCPERAELQGIRAATVKAGHCFSVHVSGAADSRVRVEKLNPATGETEQRIFRVKRDEVTMIVYGKPITFTRCNRGTTVKDSRNPAVRLSLDKAKAELCRMLGRQQGLTAYAGLTARLQG